VSDQLALNEGYEMSIVKQMIDEIRTELSNGEELEVIKDRSGEFIDSYLPIYYSDIVDEWKAMPNEFNDRGRVELGYLEQEITIYNLMNLDLYLYYSDLFAQAIQEIEGELATIEDTKEGAR
jgi:hypothetical protein